MRSSGTGGAWGARSTDSPAGPTESRPQQNATSRGEACHTITSGIRSKALTGMELAGLEVAGVELARRELAGGDQAIVHTVRHAAPAS